MNLGTNSTQNKLVLWYGGTNIVSNKEMSSLEEMVISIVKNSTKYTVSLYNSETLSTIINVTAAANETGAISETLILGAQWNNEGIPYRFVNCEIDALEVYKGAKNNEFIIKRIQELNL